MLVIETNDSHHTQKKEPPTLVITARCCNLWILTFDYYIAYSLSYL